jgi:hypothetical protein
VRERKHLVGLPIVHTIVRNHGGSVRLTESPAGAFGLRAVVVAPV